MKWRSVIVLIALALAIAAPPGISITVDHGDRPVFCTLDVCHSSTPALSTNGAMPFVNESPGIRTPAVTIAYSNQVDPIFTEFLLSNRNERPPQS